MLCSLYLIASAPESELILNTSAYFLETADYGGRWEQSDQGSQSGVMLATQFEHPLPPSPEQRRIAGILDQADDCAPSAAKQ